MAVKHFEKGHAPLEGAGRPKNSKTQCTEIRQQRRQNALKYAAKMQERLDELEKEIREDDEMRSETKYRLLVDIERIKQNEVTLSVPSEQSVTMEDSEETKSARKLLRDLYK